MERFIISYDDKVLLLNEEQLKDFLTIAVINNKDITNFTMIDLDKIGNTPLSNILNIISKVCSPVIVADLYCNSNCIVFLKTKTHTIYIIVVFLLE